MRVLCLLFLSLIFVSCHEGFVVEVSQPMLIHPECDSANPATYKECKTNTLNFLDTGACGVGAITASGELVLPAEVTPDLCAFDDSISHSEDVISVSGVDDILSACVLDGDNYVCPVSLAITPTNIDPTKLGGRLALDCGTKKVNISILGEARNPIWYELPGCAPPPPPPPPPI